jgi:Protein involved in mRNA turnover and stability
MPLQTRKPKKDGRKRTYSLVSNTTNTQAGPVTSPKTVAKSSPSQQPNGSRQALNAPAVPENQPQKPAEPAKKLPNVFEFLEENEESSSDSSSASSSESESESESDEELDPIQTTKIQSPKPRANTVPHGVLVAGGNIPPKKVAQSAPVVSKSPKEPLKPAPRPAPSTDNQLVTRTRQHTRKPSPISTANISPGKGQLELSRPSTYHDSSRDSGAVHRPPLPPSPPRSPEDSLHRTPTKRRDPHALQEPSGYGLLASHLTKSTSEESGSFPPLYRRFETVNHRVLLHLQDEISQMEEDLHLLDEYEEMHRVDIAEQEGTKPLPASRRRDAQSQAYSSLHYRRMDLMSVLIQKTEQYSKFLSFHFRYCHSTKQAR